ncbi:MAG: M48 family metallopeptidase [Actinobacteria bacterium]|nr:M48 family metallopeptidase [Actinomycetota bacterium]MBW3649517.1 M48 family metallopeptidase [Actinomycetota bacterium]
MVVLVGWIGHLATGYGVLGMSAAALAAGAAASVAWWRSDAIVLAASHARPADVRDHARLHNLVEGLCIGAGLPKPRLFVIEDPALNAFAVGRDPRHAAVAVTTGLLDKLTRVELEAVLAHELSHVKNYDIRLSTLAVTTVGAVALLAECALRFRRWGGLRHRDERSEGSRPAAVLGLVGLPLLALAPVVPRLMQRVVSPRRETLADVTAAAVTRYPPGLISALEKLRDDSTVVHSASPATAHLWIESPTAPTAPQGRRGRLNQLFNTHPPIEERIQALREL